MYVNKEQRESLGELSARIWGSTSRWQKMMKHQAFQVPDGVQEVPALTEYVYKGRTALKRATAVAKGLIKDSSDEDKNRKINIPQYRTPTADEMFFMMERVFDEKRIMVLEKDEELKEFSSLLYMFHVIDFNVEYPWNKYRLRQENNEEYAKNLKTALAELPEEMQSLITPYMYPVEMEDKKALEEAFDALQFVMDCVIGFGQYAKTKERYDEIIAKIDVIIESKRK